LGEKKKGKSRNLTGCEGGLPANTVAKRRKGKRGKIFLRRGGGRDGMTGTRLNFATQISSKKGEKKRGG